MIICMYIRRDIKKAGQFKKKKIKQLKCTRCLINYI